MATKKSNQQKKQEEKKFYQELIEKMLSLTTAGFGLVAALAWNEAIQGFVQEYIAKYFPNSAIWYRFIYAIIITFLAVFITYQLSRIASRLQSLKK